MSWFRQGSMATFTYANLPATYPTGLPVFVSNVGTKGSHWYFDGTRWKPLNGQCLLASLDAVGSNIDNNETIVFQYLMPAGLLQALDRLVLDIDMRKSGTTDSGNIRVRVGTAGTTSDTAVLGVTSMSATQVSAGLIYHFRVDAATSMTKLGRGDIGHGGSSTSAIPSAVTISNISNALYFSAAIYSSSTNNTVACGDAKLFLVSKAN